MKTKLFLFAAFAVAVGFTSCSSDDDDAAGVSSQLTGQEIAFNVGVSNSKGTRAVPVTSANYAKEMKNFSVFIKNADDGSQFAATGSNPLVYFNDGSGNFTLGGYQTTYYWPTTALSFYAYSPTNADGLSNHDTYQLTYKVPASNKAQTDIMYATTKNVTKETNNGYVNLNFGHLLSQINFKAGSMLKDHEVTISGIGINGLPASFTINLVSGELSTASETPYTVDDAAGKVVAGNALGTALLVPPCVADNEWVPGEEHPDRGVNTIAVTCKVKNTKTGKYLVGSDTEFKTVYIPFSAEFKSGVSYNFVLSFDGSNGFGYDDDGNVVTSVIGYKVSVTDWKSGDDINVGI